MLVGQHSTGGVTRGRSRPCISPRFLSYTAHTIDLARRTSCAAAWRGAHARTPRAPQYLSTDGVPCPVPGRRRSGPRRLALSEDCPLRPPRTRGQSRDSRFCGRSGLWTLTLSGSWQTGRPIVHLTGVWASRRFSRQADSERSVTGGQVMHGLHGRLDHLEGDRSLRCDLHPPLVFRPPQRLLLVVPEGGEVSAPHSQIPSRCAITSTWSLSYVMRVRSRNA